MEETKNMTAERSLEIITQQIAQSRHAVSKVTGQSLFISGICTMCMAVVIAIINFILINHAIVGLGHLLWLVLPIVIWLFSRKYNKERAHAPVDIVGSLVAKTWSTFAWFVIGFFVIALIWGFVAARVLPIESWAATQIKVTPVIVLLMGMAITITGHILKQRWLVIFGTAAGLICFIWEHFGMGQTIVLMLSGEPHLSLSAHAATTMLPCLTIFVFALVGLMLPGLMLKRQK
ncbi:MAG: hypothetical protein J5770_01435 [Bacteroidaceae bacterium]|nr:hypothetical protein [Bacteroidaceae bacterium]